MNAWNHRYPWRFGLFMAAFYSFTSVYFSFIGVYFKQLALSTRQISMLMAATPLVTLISQPLWGALGDRMKNRTVLIRLLALGAAGAALLFGLGDGFWWLLLVMVVFSALYGSIQPLGDSVILEALEPQGQPFGPIRLVGCAVFAASSLLVGGFLEGRVRWVVYLTAISMGLTALGTFALPGIGGHQKQRGGAGFMELFKQPELARLLTLVTLLQVTMGYFYAFFSIHFMTLPQSTSALLGLCYLVSSLCEIPFLLRFDRLFERFGAGLLLCSAAAALFVRWLVLACSANIWIVLATQALHGWGFVVMTTTMAKYISLTVPDALRARGQMLLSILGFGVARIIGSLGGGALSDRIGLQHGFFVAAGVSLIALIAFTPRYLRMEPLNAKKR